MDIDDDVFDADIERLLAANQNKLTQQSKTNQTKPANTTNKTNTTKPANST